MTDLSQATHPGVTPPRQLFRVAGWCVYASGIVSIFGILFLVAFFTTFIGPLGTLNDIAVVIQYGLMLPIAVATTPGLTTSRADPKPGCVAVGSCGDDRRDSPPSTFGSKRAAIRSADRDGECRISGGLGVGL